MKPTTVVLNGRQVAQLDVPNSSEAVRTLVEITMDVHIPPRMSPRPGRGENARRISLTMSDEHRERLKVLGAGDIAGGVRVLLDWADVHDDPEFANILNKESH